MIRFYDDDIIDKKVYFPSANSIILLFTTIQTYQ